MMDDELIERAARAYCKRLGLNPDEVITIPMPGYLQRGAMIPGWDAAALDEQWKRRQATNLLWKEYRGIVREAIEKRALEDAVTEALGGGGRGGI